MAHLSAMWLLSTKKVIHLTYNLPLKKVKALVKTKGFFVLKEMISKA